MIELALFISTYVSKIRWNNENLFKYISSLIK